jgi:hypothetical protein
MRGKKKMTTDMMVDCQDAYMNILGKLSALLKSVEGSPNLELAPFSACVVDEEFISSPILYLGKDVDLEVVIGILKSHPFYYKTSLQSLDTEKEVIVAVFKWSEEFNPPIKRHSSSKIEVYPPAWTIFLCIFAIFLSVLFGSLKTILFNLQ